MFTTNTLGARARLAALVFCSASLLAACGGGGGGSATGGGGTNTAPTTPTPNTPTTPTPPSAVASAATSGTAHAQPLIVLSSDGGDWVGQGRSYNYDTDSARIQLNARGAHLVVRVEGRQSWTGDFLLPVTSGQLKAGTYTNLVRYPSLSSASSGALSWIGEGRGCNVVAGTVVVNSVSYSAGILQALDMSFEQHCDGSSSALKGQIRVDADVMAQVMAPQNPLPAHPVISFVSDNGDNVGIGGSYAYDNSNAAINVEATGTHLSLRVQGDESWMGEFQQPGSASQLQPGTYTNLARYPFQAAGAGGMSWTGVGSGCNQSASTVTINSVRYDAGVLAAINLDFEHHCELSTPALRGHVEWDAQQAASGPGPVVPVPANLWSPPAGQMPATGNAMYIASDLNDYIGQGWTYWVSEVPDVGVPAGTPVDSKDEVTLSLTEAAGLLTLQMSGALNWTGQFKAMDGLTHLQPGYYGIVQRYPFQNPRKGGMNWSMGSAGCNVLSGWFAVDSIVYSGDKLVSVDLRFTQYCENSISALRGRIRWSLASQQQ